MASHARARSVLLLTALIALPATLAACADSDEVNEEQPLERPGKLASSSGFTRTGSSSSGGGGGGGGGTTSGSGDASSSSSSGESSSSGGSSSGESSSSGGSSSGESASSGGSSSGENSSSGGSSSGESSSSGGSSSGGGAQQAEPVKPMPGEVLFSEIMFNPAGSSPTNEPHDEWLELYNISDKRLDLSGLILRGNSATSSYTIPADVVLEPGVYKVAVRKRDTESSMSIPADAILLEYGAGLTGSQGLQLANSNNSSISLLDGDTEISKVAYGSFRMSSDGVSIQVKELSVAAQGDANKWCKSATAWGATANHGSPGGAVDCQ